MKTLLTIVLGLLLLLVVGASPVMTSRFKERLEDLRPVDPEQYFRLGEEVAEIARDDADRELAIRLFALADHLDPHRWRRSAILAIKPLVKEASVHRLLDANLRAWSSDVDFLPASGETEETGEDAAMAAVDALSSLRSGDRADLRRALAVDKATARFDAVSERLPGDSVWALRISRSETFGPETLDEDAVIATLEAQGELLGSEQRPWSVVLQIHQGQPMTVIEPVPLTDVFGIDAKRSSFRNGQWE
ncbi:MAG: hypothetical protein MK116_07445 [Phycisphaerales bacterium]|nr:hypothetical protein [Phycisphaerales bacterium]